MVVGCRLCRTLFAQELQCFRLGFMLKSRLRIRWGASSSYQIDPATITENLTRLVRVQLESHLYAKPQTPSRQPWKQYDIIERAMYMAG
jgi:hypothetical protein